jgi:hypothetical protein
MNNNESLEGLKEMKYAILTKEQGKKVKTIRKSV